MTCNITYVLNTPRKVEHYKDISDYEMKNNNNTNVYI